MVDFDQGRWASIDLSLSWSRAAHLGNTDRVRRFKVVSVDRLLGSSGPHRLVQWYNGRVGRASKTRRAGADGIGDVARRQMPIMFLDHPGVGMADDAK